MTRIIDIEVAGGELPLHVEGPVDSEAPALLVVPSIYGPAPDLLARLAELDDVLVVVPDPFWRDGHGVVPYADGDTAMARIGGFDFVACGREMALAADWAREHGNGTVVGLGICFGGPYVLRLAAKGRLDGLVTWHGSRMDQSLEVAADIDCPVRHHLGGEDPVTPPDAIEAIRAAFADHHDAQIIVHEGATHGFSHDGDAFDPAAFGAGFASLRELLGRD